MPFAVSGQRLEAWFLEAYGDVRIFDSFHDRKLSTDCTFWPGDGERRVCLPSATGDVVYSDAACQDALLRFDATIPQAPPEWLSASVTVDSRRVGYRVGELVFMGGLDAVQADAPEIFGLGEGGCQPAILQTALLLPSLYRLEHQRDSTFVAATSKPLRLSDDFSLQRLQAEDGAELTLAVLGHDGVACEPQLDGVCVPPPFSVLSAEPGPGLFRDGRCASPAFGPGAGFQPLAPELGIDRTSGQTRVFTLEATPAFVRLPELDAVGEPVRDASGRATYLCQADARFAAWAPGVETTQTLPVTASFSKTLGPARWVQQRAPQADNESTTPFEPGGTFLDEGGFGCKTRVTAAHELDCAVDGAEVYEIGSFSDAACEQRLYEMYGASSDEVTPAAVAPLRRFEVPASGAPQLLSFKIHSGAQYRVNAGRCEPTTTVSSLLEVDRSTPLPRFERVRR